MTAWPTIEWLATRTEAADAAVPREEAVAVLEALEQARRELAEARDRIITFEADAGKRGAAWKALDKLASLLSCEPGEVVERVRALRDLMIASDVFLSSGYHPEHEGDFVAAVNALAALAPSRPASWACGHQKPHPEDECCRECCETRPASEPAWNHPFKPCDAEDGTCYLCIDFPIGRRCHACFDGRHHPTPAPPASVAEQAQESQEFERGLRSVLMIRCVKHLDVPQLNRSESSGSECGACAVEDAIERLRTRADQWVCEKCGHIYRGNSARHLRGDLSLCPYLALPVTPAKPSEGEV